MEVQTRNLPNFDLTSNTSSFPFSLHRKIDIDSSSEHLTSDFSHSVNTDITISNFNTSQPSADDALFSHKPTDKHVQECSGFESVSLNLLNNTDIKACVTAEPLADLNSTATSTVEISCTDSTAAAAVKVQKVYRSYRTRRRLADSAVVVEEYWWQALDFAGLNHTTVSFFNGKSETVPSRWNRISANASRVGKGLSKDERARKLAFQHWIEAIDPRHRYGHSLHYYYEAWCNADAGQPFFYWLDIGAGRDVDLEKCSRLKLRQQCIKYLGPQEREFYEYIVVDGKIVHKYSGEPLDTTKGPKDAKWIFVMSAFKQLYAGEKKKGVFHHSSFLAGGATLAAGRLVAVDGTLKSIWAYSGHYRPTDDNLNGLINFLKENGVDFHGVEIRSSTEDYESNGDSKSAGSGEFSNEVACKSLKPAALTIPDKGQKPQSLVQDEAAQDGSKTNYKRTLSGGLQSPRSEVPKKELLQRLNSKKTARSNQLGHQLTFKWSTGAGPRIGCVADYPLELRLQALEFNNLSPRKPPTPYSRQPASLLSPARLQRGGELSPPSVYHLSR